MDDSDPIYTFFPDAINSSSPQTILYEALNLPSSATQEEIRKAYRKLALQYHPDKHSHKNDDKEKEELNKKFQRIGFAYTILSDEKSKKRYDQTGKTDDKFDSVGDMEGGWEAYFEGLFKRVDRKILDEDKEKYQNSSEEKSNLISSYKSSKGSLPTILNYIPHSSYTDEDRFIQIINSLIESGELESTDKWEKTSTDLKAKDKRRKAGEKAAKEAEKQAKELGVWEEFYGNGEKGKRMSDKQEEKGEGEGGLAALILKRQRDRENGLDALEEKYRKIEEERTAKKAKKGKKGEKNGPMPEISDADFEALQSKLFSQKDKDEEKKGKGKRTSK
ncbi:DNAJ domain-containing protein [Kwoniella mangroviensis CBS 10435]|uniref:DNAJ domain-containing protein n=1 Tax=Kwoniella mangroviensis CBS 10435 TaxID=1331196 RepID=A0A1B9IQ32_9TREE|nr:DNAJ domain-containing protein [Kwoniella mangroviensis CBS 10435]